MKWFPRIAKRHERVEIEKPKSIELTQGTPHDILSAIINGICQNPIAEAPYNIEAHVKDYLRQAMTVALLKWGHDPEAQEVIEYLTKQWGLKRNAPHVTSKLVASILNGDVSSVAVELGMKKDDAC